MHQSEGKKEIIFQGVGVSSGVVIAPVHVQSSGLAIPDVYEIPESEVAHEKGRFKNAIRITRDQLDELKNRVESLSGDSEAKIFEAHQLIIEDKSLNKKVMGEIESRKQNAEAVFYAVVQTYTESLRRVHDPYLSERASDLDDICQRVIRNFSDAHIPVEGPEHKHIIITHDLTPSDTAVIDRNQVLGFATEQGSVTSHTAILARSLSIPAIVGLKGIVMEVVSLSDCILDGDSGKLILHPTEETLAFYKQKQLDISERDTRDFKSSREQKVTKTKDGHVVTLSANIEFSHEVEQVQNCGAEGVGLFRTEFFLLNGGEIPSEDEQFEEYKKVAEGAGKDHLVIIRTLDAGGDKLPAEPLTDPEPNPFLGWRGIRVSLSRKAMFKNQLRAILRASAFGKLGMMFPMISGVSEVIEAKQVVTECKAELDAEGIAYGSNIQVGIMIEVPSAAVIADKLAQYVDFFSIGTNDLVQYTVAVDRVNPQVSHLYRPCNPAVIRMIKMTVDAGKKHGIWTGICGEMASMLDVVPLLIGLGVEELSVGTAQLPKIKNAIGRLDSKDCDRIATLALDSSFSKDIRQLSTDLAEAAFPEYLVSE